MRVGSLKSQIEALVMASDSPITESQITNLVRSSELRTGISRNMVREALNDLIDDYRYRGIELQEVASGFQFRVRSEFSDTVGKIFDFSVVAKIKTTCSGGSSNVLRNALKASFDSM